MKEEKIKTSEWEWEWRHLDCFRVTSTNNKRNKRAKQNPKKSFYCIILRNRQTENQNWGAKVLNSQKKQATLKTKTRHKIAETFISGSKYIARRQTALLTKLQVWLYKIGWISFSIRIHLVDEKHCSKGTYRWIRWTPDAVSTMSLTWPGCRANAASSNSFCISPSPKKPLESH